MCSSSTTVPREAGLFMEENRGEIAWADGRRDEAFRIWDEMIRQFPEDRATLVCMGDYMARAGRYEEAKNITVSRWTFRQSSLVIRTD